MADKWTFEKLHAATEAHSQKHKAEWDEKAFEEKQKKERQDWYVARSDAYQKGFEAVLAEAGWTRYDYCEEYDIQIGWDIMAGHPSHFATPSQRVSAGLRRIMKADKHCQVSGSDGRIVVRGPQWAPLHTFLDHFPPCELVELERYGWKWDSKAIGFVANVQAEKAG